MASDYDRTGEEIAVIEGPSGIRQGQNFVDRRPEIPLSTSRTRMMTNFEDTSSPATGEAGPVTF
jgi:hypothetical protein